MTVRQEYGTCSVVTSSGGLAENGYRPPSASRAGYMSKSAVSIGKNSARPPMKDGSDGSSRISSTCGASE